MSTYTDFVNFLEDYNRYRAEIFSVYLTFNKLSNGISFVFVTQNFIICTCLRMSTYTDFVNFLEDYNRYRAEFFRVNITFNDLFNDISHVVVARSFIICTCLSYVDIVCVFLRNRVFRF